MKSDRIKNWPKEERPRERLLSEGADKLTEAKLLAIILRVGQGTFKEGVRGQNAPDFARTLLSEFGRLAGLDRAHVQDLLKVPGLGLAKVAQIKAAFRLGKLLCAGRSAAVSFESSQAIADYFRPRFIGKRQHSEQIGALKITQWVFNAIPYHSFKIHISRQVPFRSINEVTKLLFPSGYLIIEPLFVFTSGACFFGRGCIYAGWCGRPCLLVVSVAFQRWFAPLDKILFLF